MIRKMRCMSGAGDHTVTEWDTETLTAERLTELETEFNQRMKDGYFAANLQTETLVKEFDPNADTLFIPRMQGGRS